MISMTNTFSNTF